MNHEATVVCACGATFKTGTTKDTDVIKVEICNKCQPHITGKQKLVDAGGRVDKFKKRYGSQLPLHSKNLQNFQLHFC